MTRGLIITDCDPVDASFDRRARLNQSIRLFSDAGYGLDVIFLANRHFDFDLSDKSPLVVDGIDQIGVLPPDIRQAQEDHRNPHILELIAGLRGERGAYDIIHLDRVLVEPAEELCQRWLVDCYDRPFDQPWVGRKFDVLFAADDDVRSANADFAQQSFRFPLKVLDPPMRHTGQMIGWVGRFNASLAQRWSDLLDVLARRGARLRPGILLAGEGADGIQVPPVLSSAVVKTANAAAGTERALALAILPSRDVEAWLARLTTLIAAECPVLADTGIAGRFEDRWHLPAFEDIDRFADAIEAWCEGDNRESLQAATRSSAEAFSYDQAAMYTYVKSSIPTPASGEAKA